MPARAVPEFVAEVYAKGLTGAETLRPVVERYAQVPDPAPDEFYMDVGGSGPFCLAGSRSSRATPPSAT